jgi:membrane-associated phospholipid phosphatase
MRYLKIFIAALLSFSAAQSFAQRDTAAVPFTKIFYKMGTNALQGLTYNYGANFAVAALGSYGLVQSGADWRWNRMSANNKYITFAGIPAGAIGMVAPVVVPLTLYFYGRKHDDAQLQITGLALGQSAALAVSFSFAIKTFTGRKGPGVLAEVLGYEPKNPSDYIYDWAFGFYRRGVFDGWPSSHTIVAFAMASTLATLYPDNTWVQVGSYAYAGFVGVSVSLFSHWFSDAFAGALMGYAIGKSVGHSFNQLLGKEAKKNYSLYVVPNGVGMAVRF